LKFPKKGVCCCMTRKHRMRVIFTREVIRNVLL
jgi:hypothetical protein